MPLKTPDEYRASIVGDGRRLYYRGKRIDDILSEPELRVAVDHAAIDYEVAESAAHREARAPQQELALGPPPEPDAVHELLDALDPDTLSPKQALDALYALKRTKG